MYLAVSLTASCENDIKSGTGKELVWLYPEGKKINIYSSGNHFYNNCRLRYVFPEQNIEIENLSEFYTEPESTGVISGPAIDSGNVLLTCLDPGIPGPAIPYIVS